MFIPHLKHYQSQAVSKVYFNSSSAEVKAKQVGSAALMQAAKSRNESSVGT